MAAEPVRPPTPKPTPHAARSLTPDRFAKLFDRTARRLWCVAVAIVGDVHLAEDIVQEAAIVGLGKLGQYRPGTDFGAWMAQIVRYVALNHARRDAKEPPPSDPIALASLTPDTTSDASGSARDSAPIGTMGNLMDRQAAFDDRLVEALEQLDETARACLLLRTVLDLPYREIAGLLNIPEGTAMSHVHRSRRFLRSRLTTVEPAGRASNA